MALPTWLARINRRFTNPAAIKRGKWPVLTHVGRTSGVVYRTPLEAYPTSTGYLFTVNYASSDWPRNVMAAGGAQLDLDGGTIDLENPRMVPTEEAYSLLEPGAKTPPSWVGVRECLVTDVATAHPPASDSDFPSRSTP